MEFGINFSPTVAPADKPAARYWSESLHLVGLCDALGFRHVRCVEHHFSRYGGYSPNPTVFLAAAAQRTKRARLMTGALLPVFNHPLKMAGEIGMLDAICGGRLEVGFARAFLPHEFEAYGVPLDESRARFVEGVEQVRRLLEEEDVTMQGRFHSFGNVTSLPRSTQRPRPPIWIAAFATPRSFEDAGRLGYDIMAIPRSGRQMTELIGLYRESRGSAGHPGKGRVMLSFLMHCAPTTEEAVEVARPNAERHVAAMIECTAAWVEGASSADYPDYGRMFAGLKDHSFDDQRARGAIWVGSPDDICDTVSDYAKSVGGFEAASMPVNFNMLTVEQAERSMRLFSEKVMPRIASL